MFLKALATMNPLTDWKKILKNGAKSQKQALQIRC